MRLDGLVFWTGPLARTIFLLDYIRSALKNRVTVDVGKLKIMNKEVAGKKEKADKRYFQEGKNKRLQVR